MVSKLVGRTDIGACERWLHFLILFVLCRFGCLCPRSTHRCWIGYTCIVFYQQVGNRCLPSTVHFVSRLMVRLLRDEPGGFLCVGHAAFLGWWWDSSGMNPEASCASVTLVRRISSSADQVGRAIAGGPVRMPRPVPPKYSCRQSTRGEPTTNERCHFATRSRTAKTDVLRSGNLVLLGNPFRDLLDEIRLSSPRKPSFLLIDAIRLWQPVKFNRCHNQRL